jgi:glutathione S-transferase
VPEDGFLVGEAVTLADLAVVSPLANLRHLGLDISAADHPKTARYAERILSRPSFEPILAREGAALQRLRAA